MHLCMMHHYLIAYLQPQTLKVFGDDDPIDVVEIGSVALASGSVTPVKALGVLAMIDDGELDWKVVAIAASDPMADELNDVADIEAKMPGTLSGIREWFRWYKVRRTGSHASMNRVFLLLECTMLSRHKNSMRYYPSCLVAHHVYYNGNYGNVCALCFLQTCACLQTPDDKPLNAFGYDEEFLSAAKAKEVIQETHESWKGLQSGSIEAGKLWLK